jgi:hypothetical protein
MDDNINDLIRQAAALWLQSPNRPTPTNDVLERWDAMLDAWVRDKSMPLLIRKSSLGRGKVVFHTSGRALVPTDNTPAHWALALALRGNVPTLAESLLALSAGELGVALAFRPGECERAIYKGRWKNWPELKGFSVRHIAAVNAGSNVPLTNRPINELLEHTARFLSPRNMFVVTRKSGLGEVPAFIEAFQNVSMRAPRMGAGERFANSEVPGNDTG